MIFYFILGSVLFLCGRYRKLNFIYSENVLFCLRFIWDEFYFDTKKLNLIVTKPKLNWN